MPDHFMHIAVSPYYVDIRINKKAMDFSPTAFRILLIFFEYYIFLKTTGDGFNPINRRERHNNPERLSKFNAFLFSVAVIFRSSKKKYANTKTKQNGCQPVI
jgi:hypothetical protein